MRRCLCHRGFTLMELLVVIAVLGKKPALKPMAMKTEGPFLKGRKWYSQFYADRADVKSTQDAVNGLYHVPGVQTPAERNPAIYEGLPI
mgnify:CR=1 FL=1